MRLAPNPELSRLLVAQTVSTVRFQLNLIADGCPHQALTAEKTAEVSRRVKVWPEKQDQQFADQVTDIAGVPSTPNRTEPAPAPPLSVNSFLRQPTFQSLQPFYLATGNTAWKDLATMLADLPICESDYPHYTACRCSSWAKAAVQYPNSSLKTLSPTSRYRIS